MERYEQRDKMLALVKQYVDHLPFYRLNSILAKVKYFHLVFTIPESLNSLFYLNQQAAYNILFKAAGKAMSSVAQNTKYLGAKTGAVGILHKWARTIRLPDKHESFERLKQECYRKKWVVHCEKPFDSPKHLISLPDLAKSGTLDFWHCVICIRILPFVANC